MFFKDTGTYAVLHDCAHSSVSPNEWRIEDIKYHFGAEDQNPAAESILSAEPTSSAKTVSPETQNCTEQQASSTTGVLPDMPLNAISCQLLVNCSIFEVKLS